MAAEKLTKARLIQILIIFSVLVTAFTWRTIVYQPQNDSENLCQIKNDCELNIVSLHAKLMVNKKNRDTIEIKLQPVNRNKKLSNLSLDISTDNSENQIRLVKTNSWEVTLSPNQKVSNWSVLSNKKEIYTFKLHVLE